MINTPTDIKSLSPEWLALRVQAMIEDEDDDAIDPAENLVLYGLDSIAVMTFSSELARMGLSIAFEDMAKEPTINAWWALIAARI